MAAGGPGGIRGGERPHSCSSIELIKGSRTREVDETARSKMHKSAPEMRASKWGVLKRNWRKFLPVASFMVKFATEAAFSKVTGRLTREEKVVQTEMIAVYNDKGIEGLVKHLYAYDSPQRQKIAAGFLKSMRDDLYQRLPVQEERVIHASEQLEKIALSPENLVGVGALSDRLKLIEGEYKQLHAELNRANELLKAKARIPDPTAERYADLEKIEKGKVTYWLGLRTQELTNEERGELEAMRDFKVLLLQEENVWNVQLPDPGELASTIGKVNERFAEIDAIKDSLQTSEDEVLNSLTHSLLYGVEASDISINDYTEELLVSFAKQHAVRMPLPPQLDTHINRIGLGEKAGSQLFSTIQAARR